MRKHSIIYPLIGLVSAFFFVVAPTTRATQTNATCTEKNIKREVDHNFGVENDNPESLKVSILSSTKTTTGQSFSFSFSTGGQGFADTTGTYLISPDDPDFDAYYNDFNTKSVEERNELATEIEEGRAATENFNASVYSITGKAANKNIILPKVLSRNTFFNLNVTSISSKVITSWEDIESIQIPNTIESISSDSFVDVPEGIKFKVEFASASEIPSTWAEDWAHGATVVYGATYTSKQANPKSAGGAGEYGDKEKVYILGYYAEDKNYPLVIEYKLVTTDKKEEIRFYDVPLQSGASNYHDVGYNSFKTELNADISLNAGEQIAVESITIHNIFKSPKEKIDPDFTTRYVATPSIGYTHLYSADEFMNIDFERISSFGKYLAIDVNISIPEINIYEILKSSYYKTHKANIDAGKSYIRYRVYPISQCSYKITFVEDGELKTAEIKMKSPINQIVLQQKGSQKSAFILPKADISNNAKFNAKDIRAISLNNVYVTLDIYGENGPVARSSVVTRFGNMNIYDSSLQENPNEGPKVFNINTFLVLICTGYVVLFAAGTTGLFFYSKEKYKNDEFKRVKPKQFLKKAAISLFGSLIVLVAVVSIILRATVLSNAVVVYNPIDAFIIVCGVISVVVIGYFGFYIFKTVKTIKERNRIIKLKLAEDTDDDGTK